MVGLTPYGLPFPSLPWVQQLEFDPESLQTDQFELLKAECSPRLSCALQLETLYWETDHLQLKQELLENSARIYQSFTQDLLKIYPK